MALAAATLPWLASAFLLSVLATFVAAVPATAAPSGMPGDFAIEAEVSEALSSSDECSAESSEEGACGLSALQLRGHRTHVSADSGNSITGGDRAVRRSQGNIGARSGYEVAPAHRSGWARVRRCDGTELHELGFVLRQPNLERLRTEVRARSNPDSPSYRQWLSRAEISELLYNEETVQKVTALLSDHSDISVVKVSDEGELITARAPVATWEALLSAEFHAYAHEDHSHSILRTTEYLLPEGLSAGVDGLLAAVDFDELAIRGANAPVSPELKDLSTPSFGFETFEELKESKHGAVITPDVLRERYDVPEVAARGSEEALQQAKTWQVVYATLGQYWSPSDRAQFERTFQIPEDNYVHQIEGQLSGNAKSGDLECRESPNECSESNLDVQYMMGLAPWARIGYWYVPKATATGMSKFLNDFMERFVHTDDVPHVISISYGMPEFSVTKTSLMLFETLAMKLALRGVTMLVASGDDGAASFLARKRLDGKECWSVSMIGLQASWPASSEFVTSVGATMGAELGAPEIACSVNDTSQLLLGGSLPQITTGGGYSQNFARPDWQSSSHQEVGRGIPDLALAGHSYAVVLGTRWLTVDGTSASAPALAGMISLINAELIAKGQPTVGFLNPILYRESSASIFTDVTQGNNRCAALGSPCCGGYDAGEGWDPVSGLGTPNFLRLRDSILKAAAESPPLEVDSPTSADDSVEKAAAAHTDK